MVEPSTNDAAAKGLSIQPPGGAQPAVLQHADLPCPFCGCLCDDLQLSVTEGRVVEVVGACQLARPQILAAGSPRPEGRIAGRDVPRAEAVREAARVLSAARSPLIWGLGRATCEAQAAAVEIAELLRGAVDVPGNDEALQTVGEVSCTLGEIRQRADMIVVWGADPLETHPRLLERHAPPGIRLTVIGSRATATAKGAEFWLQTRPGREFEAATMLRALLRNISLAEDQVLDQTGVTLATWRELLDRMKKARYGVLLSATSSGRSTAESVALARLIRELNDQAHWVHLVLPTAANSAGAKNVLAWRTGFSRSVDFSASNSPASDSGLVDAEQLLERGEVDAALVVCDDPAEYLSRAAKERLAAIPTVVIDSQQTAIWQAADIALTAALPGIEASGTMFRMDGVPLALRQVIDSPQLADFELLRMLAAAIRGASVEFLPGKPGG